MRFGDLLQAICVLVGVNLFGWMLHQFAVLNLVLSLAWIGLAVDPATSPARPLYIKPPDARPNTADAIARAPA